MAIAITSSLQILVKNPLSSSSSFNLHSFSCNISPTSLSNINNKVGIRSNQNYVGKIMSESKEPPAETAVTPKASTSLKIGSPVIIVEAPQMLKTAASMPCLRVNSGLVKPGDVGRIMSRKPMDVWAVRLTIGTYLIDGKYFKPLQLDEDS